MRWLALRGQIDTCSWLPRIVRFERDERRKESSALISQKGQLLFDGHEKPSRVNARQGYIYKRFCKAPQPDVGHDPKAYENLQSPLPFFLHGMSVGSSTAEKRISVYFAVKDGK